MVQNKPKLELKIVGISKDDQTLIKVMKCQNV